MKDEQKPDAIPGISREEEEKHLAAAIRIAQNNLDKATESVETLKQAVKDLQNEINRSREKDGLLLWNNAKAQYRQTLRELSRFEKARKKPYFGRIDFTDEKSKKKECYYIGRVGISRKPSEPVVIDWRTPAASVYYENSMGRGSYTVRSGGTFEIDLERKRSYEIAKDQLVDFYDLDVVANDELLTKYLSKNKTEVLGEIIATIQKEQNRIIRRSPKTNVIVQGVAGSGKTTVAMHRISYILFNYEEDFRPEDFYVIGSNEVLLNYITGVLPDLDVYGVKQMTMEQLFVRLLYEDWDSKKYRIKGLTGQSKGSAEKGNQSWFFALEAFCRAYESEQIPRKNIRMEKTGKLLLSSERIERFLAENPGMSMQSKRLMLNEILYSRYENEIAGRGFTFTQEERKELDKRYHFYFGKDEWKGSILELYQEFLKQQIQAGHKVEEVAEEFDLYDLAALAYLYKRIKEIDPIREASHVVIDEAQDFGMMAYCCLHYCMRGCTYTIMGDTSQNIHFGSGLNDWNELRSLMLKNPYDSFSMLKKSYRNTIEISDFATEILRHGDFSIYPAEPILRHGNPVTIKQTADSELISTAAQIIEDWQREGYETIAVICRDDAESLRVSEELGGRIALRNPKEGEPDFGAGVMVLSVAYTKGLEFDAVLIFDPSEEKYPPNNGSVKQLYVTATRALHELTVLDGGNLTPLIKERAPEGKHMEAFEENGADVEQKKKRELTQEEKTRELREEAVYDLKQRGRLGPKSITLKPEQIKGPEDFSGRDEKQEEPNQAKETQDLNPSPYAYGSIPEEAALKVKGHSKPNGMVKWAKKTKSGLEITSSYGTLMLSLLKEDVIRVTFRKGQGELPENSFFHGKAEPDLKWTAKESPKALQLITKKLIVHVEKRDGRVIFLTPERKVLLSEKAAVPRLIEGKDTWVFFEEDKKERIYSKGILSTDRKDITMKARYISFGGKKKRMPLLLSGKGYGIGIAAERTVLYCGVPMFGPYVYADETEWSDYCFFYGGNTENTIRLYEELS